MPDLAHRRILVSFAVLAAGFLMVRYVAAIAFSESGSSVAGEAWANAVYAAAAREFVPVSRRFPEEQAAFWMARTESLPDDPDLLCGAALILSEPSPAYRTRLLKRKEGHLAEAFRDIRPPVDFDDKAINRAEEAFQEQTTERCLDLLRRATALAPEDRDLWRIRALLLFRGFMTPRSWEPRTADWASILDEAQRHDPDNALYDLIAAVQLLLASAEMDYTPEVPRTTPRDRLLMEAAARRLNRGLTRRHLQLGASRSPCVWRFLSTVRGVGVAPLQLGAANEFESRTVFLLRDVVRWQRSLAQLAVTEERPEDAVRALDLLLNLPRQLEARDGNDLAYLNTALMFRQVIIATIEADRQKIPGAESKWSAEQLTADMEAAKQDLAETNLRATQLRQPPVHIQGIWPIIAAGVATFAPVLFIPCLVAGGAFLGFWLALRRNNAPISVIPLAGRWWILFWLGGLTLAGGSAWLSTFVPSGRRTPSHATALDDMIRETWGRSAFALITFLREPVGWTVLAWTVGLLLISTIWRHARSSSAGWKGVLSEPKRWAEMFVRDGARLLLGTATFLLLLHVACLPTEVAAVEFLDQQWQAWGADPQARWAAWDATATAVP